MTAAALTAVVAVVGDGAGFVEGAKTHFIRLQAAWDRSDFTDIRDYTSPQMYAELKRESADRCPRALGNRVKRSEVIFHHEVTNQLLWSKF